MNTTLYGNAKILIVEDESIIVKSLENRLLKAGYDVIGNAASGKEAIEMARQLNPDLILMDIKLDGEMTGIEAASEINKFLNIPYYLPYIIQR
jgi:YesN/AraC family two-component response regulator